MRNVFLENDEKYKENSEQLFSDMAEWRKVYRHQNPCEEYLENGFCKHLVKARTKKFERRISENLKTRLKLFLGIDINSKNST